MGAGDRGVDDRPPPGRVDETRRSGSTDIGPRAAHGACAVRPVTTSITTASIYPHGILRSFHSERHSLPVVTTPHHLSASVQSPRSNAPPPPPPPPPAAVASAAAVAARWHSKIVESPVTAEQAEALRRRLESSLALSSGVEGLGVGLSLCYSLVQVKKRNLAHS